MTSRLARFVPWPVAQTAAWLSALFSFSTVFLNIPYQISEDIFESRRTFFARVCEIKRERQRNVKFTGFFEDQAGSWYMARGPPALEI